MAKILLVEDDKSLREIYGVRLMAEGYEIVSAGDGEEALAMAIKERPDLIVSDVMMPKISGFDMLDILRSTSETKNVKVIMMTALSSDDQRARGEALGADRYLVKSQVGIEDVVRTVHDVLGDSIAQAAPAQPSFGPSATPAPAAPTPEPVAAMPQFNEPAPTPAAPTPAPFEPAPFDAPQPAFEAPASPGPIQAPQPSPEAPVSAPAQPSFDTPAPAAPEPTPVPTQEAPTQPAPVAAPVFVPPTPSEPAAPQYTNPAPAPAAFEPVPAPAAQPAPAAFEPTPAPVQPVVPPAPVLSELPAAPAPSSMPQPTAPFSTPAPASLGERVIEPLTAPSVAPVNDIASQIEQALGTATPPTQDTPQVPPAA